MALFELVADGRDEDCGFSMLARVVRFTEGGSIASNSRHKSGFGLPSPSAAARGPRVGVIAGEALGAVVTGGTAGVEVPEVDCTSAAM